MSWKINESNERDHEYFDTLLKDYGIYIKIVAIMVAICVAACAFIEVQLQARLARLEYTVAAVDDLQFEVERLNEKAYLDENSAYAAYAAETSEPDIVVYGYNPDIPLSPDLQIALENTCDIYGVPYALALAVAETESGFNPDADNGQCFGLMQINRLVFSELRAEGIEPENYYGNIEAGVKILAGHMAAFGGNYNKALLAYNCGERGATEKIEAGQESSAYTEKVMSRYALWLEKLE